MRGLSKYFGDNENEFEAWTVNVCEEFEETDWTIDWFKDIIEDKNKFIDIIKKNNSNRRLYLK